MSRYREGTALIVVDMQNDFADPAGSLYVNGGAELVPFVNAEIVRATASNASVIYTADWHPPTTRHFAKDGGIWPVHCVADTWGAEFNSRLLLVGPTVRKGVRGEDGYSGFTVADAETGATSPTDLKPMLDELGAHSVVVVGLALDYCVKATALDGADSFEVILPADLTAPVDIQPGDGERALDACRDAGVRIV